MERQSYVEGRNPVRELLKGRRSVRRIIVSEDVRREGIADILEAARKGAIPVSYVTRDELSKISTSRSHQGVIAVCDPFTYTDFEEMVAQAKRSSSAPFIIVVDGIEDPGNLGSIIRTAESMGVHGIVLRERREVGVTPTVEKSSAGASEHIAICRVTNLTRSIQRLKEAGIWVAGTSAEAPQRLYQVDLTVPLAVVIGGEGKGMSRLVQENCDFVVSIPLFGLVNSLNAAVAASILMYEVVRQRAHVAAK